MKRVVLMVLILVCGSLPARINHHFEVIIPSYNNRQNMFDGEPVYKKNLMSVFSQTYTNYHVRYIDDASPDGTGFAVQELVKKLGYQDRVEVQINGASVGALCNRYLATHACDDRSIIVTLDGDDWLAHDRVLEQLNELYQDEDVWMTYGQFKRCCNSCIFVGAPQFYRNSAECQHSEEDDSICHPLPSRDVIDRNEMREYIRDHRPGHSWIFGALRTFYAGLFKKIQVQDLVSEGLFYGIGEDTAVTIYMVEMAGHHVRFVSDISYIYNNALRIPSGRDIIRPIF